MNNLEILERERLRQDVIKVLKTEAYKQFPEIKELTLDVKIVEMNEKGPHQDLIGVTMYDTQGNKCIIKKVASSYSKLNESCPIAEETFSEGYGDPNQDFVWVEAYTKETGLLEDEYAFPLSELSYKIPGEKSDYTNTR